MMAVLAVASALTSNAETCRGGPSTCERSEAVHYIDGTRIDSDVVFVARRERQYADVWVDEGVACYERSGRWRLQHLERLGPHAWITFDDTGLRPKAEAEFDRRPTQQDVQQFLGGSSWIVALVLTRNESRCAEACEGWWGFLGVF